MPTQASDSYGHFVSGDARRIRGWQMAVFGGLLALNNLVDAMSTSTDYARAGIELERWQPFVWEFSSGLMIDERHY